MIERTTPTDLMQLACDLPGSPMQVAAVLVLGNASALDLTAVRDAIGQRLRAVPRLRQRLVRTSLGCGRPIWVDDPDFDLRDHVTAVPCPAPGDQAALLSVVAETVTHRLARNRPLWSATLVTALSDDRVALIVMLHHVLADGVGGLAVLARLVDGMPIAASTDFPRPAPTRRAQFAEASGTRLRAFAHLPAGARRIRSAVGELTAGGVARPPRSSLNQPTGARRSLAVARADLAGVQQAAHAHGATVNDVVLVAVTGALRAVLACRGERIDRFVVSVPVSVRREATAGQLGNQVGVMEVPVHVAGDRHSRLAAIAATTRERKPAAPSSSTALLGPAMRAIAWLGAFRWFVNRQRLITTLVTNLHGPQVRLSLLGAPITDVIPVSSITGNVTVAFTVLSYAGTLVVTAVADPELCPDLPVLVAHLQRELDLFATDRAAAG